MTDLEGTGRFRSSVMHLYLCLCRAYLLDIFVASFPHPKQLTLTCAPLSDFGYGICAHIWLRGLLFEVSLVASASWLHHHPICHLEGAHFYKHCSPIHTITLLLTLLGGSLLL